MRATVVIPTYNGEKYLDEILTAVEGQHFDGEIEILVVDSGSTDATLHIVARHPSVRLHTIPNAEFGHGRTRNLAAGLATGEFVAYLTHDAIPADEWWLTELLAPLRTFPGVEAVLGRQIPRALCPPIYKYEISRAFAAQGPEFGTTVSFETDAFDRAPLLREYATIYSDVNSAARRSFLLETIPYRDVSYAEDQLFGQDVLAAGYRKAYASRGAVVHSNDLTLREYSRRLFDEIVGLRLAGAPVPAPQPAYRAFVRGMVLDPIDILVDQEYGVARKVGWLFANPFWHLAKYRAGRRARRVDITDAAAIARGSLEATRKRRQSTPE